MIKPRFRNGFVYADALDYLIGVYESSPKRRDFTRALKQVYDTLVEHEAKVDAKASARLKKRGE